ncbi:nuclear transport factor 2 family protein [Winogradskyella maritima]|uniref:Nuclear transport factor 2 family protein n=1 Tax=Winogradskyella maritima TaxID=1517766 RepID=A0ABV8AIN6_9FLAO|nr:nuclear transport factor 2 family protein [Winogradskyella maritima]
MPINIANFQNESNNNYTRMKSIATLFICLFSIGIFAQTSEEDAVKNTIDTFFEAFHKQDTVALKSMVTKEVILQSIGKGREGDVRLNTSEFHQFITSIASIPKDKGFKEKLLGYEIKIDGDMANAWTPYEFWFDGNFSHCGVNSFQLIKLNGDWKIFYLVDTRRREGCQTN